MKLSGRQHDDDSVRLHRRTLREIIAPLSFRERLTYGILLIFLAYALFSSVSSAADYRFGTVVRIPSRQCLSDESWQNPSLASGQQYSAVGLPETAVVPLSGYAAISSGQIGGLVCDEFEATDDIKVSQALSIYVSSIDPDGQSLSDSSAELSLVSPDFSISESPSRETFIEPMTGQEEQHFELDGLLMVEISTVGGEWDLIAVLSANQLGIEMSEINVGLPMKYQVELADLQFRFTPLQAGDQSPLIAVDSVAISYLVGADKATELRAFSPVAISEDSQWALDPNGDFQVELVIDDPNVSLLGGLGRELMDRLNSPDTPIIQTTFELVDKKTSSTLPVIAKSAQWQGRNIDGTSTWQFSLDIPRDLTIGEYALQATTVFEDGTITTTRQDFLWGVLALNTNKTVYQVSETADIMMTVLDPIGATDCQADLVLTVQSATNTTIFRTSDGSIIKNDSCYEYGPQITPDYQTQYYFQETGVYTLTLQATTANGTYSTSDSIEVQESVPLNIERTGPTRIYPIVGYSMLLNVTATEFFNGRLTESVPRDFVISQISADNQFSLTADPNTDQSLAWDIQLEPGQSISVGYNFDAPDISPEFYLLGKATLLDPSTQIVFEETRLWQLASDATADTIDSTILDATDEFGASPAVVFTDASNGYAFYIDATSQTWAYAKTTDGGTTWGAAVTIDTARNWTKVAVWYDQWTPGDNSGTLIHIIATEDGTDDGYYTYLDTSTDTLRAAPVMAMASTSIGELTSGGPSITKGGSGYLFVTMNSAANPVGGQIAKSTNGGTSWVAITPAAWSGADTDQVQLLPLLTNSDIIAIKADTTNNTIDSRVYDEAGDAWDGTWTNIATLTDNTTYDQWFSATINRPTGDVYLTFANATAVAGNDIEFWSYSNSTRGWTQKTNLFTDDTTVMMPVPVMDGAKDTVYVAYLRGVLGSALSVYFQSSADGGGSWSTEQGRINITVDDIRGLRGNLLNDFRLFAVWYNDDLNYFVGNTIIELIPTMTQSGYRLFANADSTDVGSPLAAQNNSFTLVNAGDAFRIRMLVHVEDRPLRIDGRKFKIQYAGKGAGTCVAPSGTPSSYRVVTDYTAISYKNNTPLDGVALTTNTEDPVHDGHTSKPQTYEELNNFINSQSAVSVGEDGLWDFALYDNGAPSSTAYCFRIILSDGRLLDTYGYYPVVQTVTPNVAPDSPTSLIQKKTNDTMLSTDSWTDEPSVKFEIQASDSNNPDYLQLCVEVDTLGTTFSNTEDSCSAATLYSGTPITLVHTLSSFSHGISYHWQARLKDTAGAYSSWASYGGNPENEADFRIDFNAPTGTVYDGISAGVDTDLNDGSLDELSANWSITDSDSGVANYDYSIGTSPGSTDVSDWVDINLDTSATVTTLSLKTGQAYYFNTRATDNVGNQAITSSDGQIVAPSLSFSTAPGEVSFDDLTSLNGYTSEKDVTVTTSTNAYGGYIIRMVAVGVLENQNLADIGFFNGGTYLSPDGWIPGDFGYGYTSSDNLVQGSNIFHPLTCLGGHTSPCFAPLSTSPPGDIIADNPGPIIGTPISNENFIITHRVTAASSQEAGIYTTEVIYSAIPIY